jgi:hypothetical protein
LAESASLMSSDTDWRASASLVCSGHGELRSRSKSFSKIAEIRSSVLWDGGAPKVFGRLWHLCRVDVREAMGGTDPRRVAMLALLHELTPVAA